MAFDSCFSCIKYSVFVFNFFMWLLGCTLLSLGGWLLMDEDAGRHVYQLTSTTLDDGGSATIVSYNQLTGSDLSTVLAYVFIAVGCLLIFVAFVGCCGAVRESQCMLGAYFIVLFIVFTVMLGLGIWTFVRRNDVDAHTFQLQRLTNRMVRNAVQNYDTDPKAKHFMDTLQERFRCCGADEAAGDYVGFRQPPCQVAYQRRSCLPAYFNYAGTEVENFMKDRLTILGSVSFGFAACLVLGMISVLLLCCAVKERRWNTNA